MNKKQYSFTDERRPYGLRKKLTLKESAREIFADKGYKATSISEIAKQARMAVGSFYKYYESKEDIFLDVYIDENNIIRQTMIDNIDWDGDMVELISQIFGWSRSLISSNKILLEWYNSDISEKLHNYYSSEKGIDSNPFHLFLVDKFTNRMLTEGYSQEKIQEVLQVYQLFYYMDTHITEADLPNASKTIESLATYFVKGLFK